MSVSKLHRYCLALDLKDDPDFIQKYKEHHTNVWPEILESIRDSGIREMEIFLVYNRLFMILEVDDSFSFSTKIYMDSQNEFVQKWEELMWNYQKKLPKSKAGEKWVLMEKIFEL